MENIFGPEKWLGNQEFNDIMYLMKANSQTIV